MNQIVGEAKRVVEKSLEMERWTDELKLPVTEKRLYGEILLGEVSGCTVLRVYNEDGGTSVGRYISQLRYFAGDTMFVYNFDPFAQTLLDAVGEFKAYLLGV